MKIAVSAKIVRMCAAAASLAVASSVLLFCGCAGNEIVLRSAAGSSSSPTSSSPPSAESSEPASQDAGRSVPEAPVSLLEAIELSADKIAGQLSAGSRVAIVSFGAEHDNISEFIMEELSAALFNGGIMVTDRENLEYVKREVLLQMSDAFDDNTIVSIGNLLGADMTVNGNLFDLGGTYRYQTNVINNRSGSRVGSANVTVRNDDAMKRTITALSAQTRRVRVAKDLASVAAQTPETVGGFIDRGIAYAARNDFDSAIADFESALRLDPNNAAAKNHIERLSAKRGH